MNHLKKLLLLMGLSLLGGCSFLQSFHSQSTEYVEVLIQEKQYSRAENVLQHISPSHPDYPALMAQKKRLHKLSNKLEKNALAQVRKLRKQNKWQQALQTLHSARTSLPESQLLRKAEQDFLAARNKRINELNMKIDIHKGIWLKDAEPLLDAIVRTQPDNYVRQQQQQQFKLEKARTLKNLARCAREAMDEELYELGRHCLELVNKIDRERQYTESLKQAKVKLQQHDHAWRQQQIKLSGELLKELKQGYSHDNLLRASRHLQKLSSHDQSAEEKQYSSMLKQELDKGIAQNMDAGRQLYSAGKVTEALSIWTSLRQITPDNEALEAHISRAQRVLKKLERLEKQQSSSNKTLPQAQ